MQNKENDWDINPENYLTDEKGNFKLRADGTPRKKGGRPKGSKGRGYNYHSETKAKQAASSSIQKASLVHTPIIVAYNETRVSVTSKKVVGVEYNQQGAIWSTGKNA